MRTGRTPHHAPTPRGAGRRLSLLLALAAVGTALGAGAPPLSTAEAVGQADSGPARTDSERFIDLNGYRFDPRVGTPDVPASLRHRPKAADEADYFIVQVGGPVLPRTTVDLESLGTRFLHALGRRAFIVRSTPNAIARARAHAAVRWAGPFEPAYKLSPSLDLKYDAVLNAAIDRELAQEPSLRGRAHVDATSTITVRV